MYLTKLYQDRKRRKGNSFLFSLVLGKTYISSDVYGIKQHSYFELISFDWWGLEDTDFVTCRVILVNTNNFQLYGFKYSDP